jgi:hypothetical protein
MAQEEYYSFEDVLKDLEIGEEELKRMVSEGELRAFRDENKMKFRKDDVENLRKGRTTEPTLILPVQEQQASDTAETILDLDAAPPSVDEAGPALELPAEGAAAQGADTQDVTKQIDFTDTDITVADEPVAADVGGDVEEGTTTEPLQLVEEGTTEPVPTEEEPVAAAAAPAPRRRAARTIEITEAEEEAIEARKPGPWWTAMLLVSFVAVAYAGFYIYDMLMIQSGRISKPSGRTEYGAEKLTEWFYSDGEWKKRVGLARNYSPNNIPTFFLRTAPWKFTVEERELAGKGISYEESTTGAKSDTGTPPPAPAPEKPAEEKKADK